MNNINILHLSDLHYNESQKKDTKIVLEALFKDLKKLQYEENLKIDCIMFSGDLVYSSDKKEFEAIDDIFIAPLLKKTGLNQDNFFISPGNHDIQRSKIEKYSEVGLKETLKNRDEVNEFIDNIDKNQDYLSRLSNFNEFKRKIESRHKINSNILYSTYHMEIEDCKIGVACLNSSWRAFGGSDDEGKLIIGERQIDNALSEINDNDLKIAVMHHPFEWLAEFDRIDVKRRLFSGFDLLLVGHTHHKEPELTDNLAGKIVLNNSGCLYHSRNYYNGYSIISYNHKDRKVVVYLRTYFDKRREFDKALDDIGGGKKEFFLDCDHTIFPQKTTPQTFFDKDITKNMTKEAKQKWKSLGFRKAAQKYADKTRDLHGTMKIWLMASPIELEGIFTNVNVLRKQSALRSEKYLNKAGFADSIEQSLDGLKAVSEDNRLIILGKPGAGKTTFLKYIVLQAVDGKMESCIPIFVTLRDFSESGKLLFDFIAEQFAICDFPDAEIFIKTILEEGKAVILCDGLDEVSSEGGVRDNVIKQLKGFSNQYNKARYVVTCRVAATYYDFDNFTYVEMADFDDDQTESFVKKWFAEQEKVTESFLKEFRKTRGGRLRDLAKNPLLLTLLCIGYKETLEFPSRRSKIYDDALDVLLNKWDTTRIIKRDEIYSGLSADRKNRMFAQIAAETFEVKQYLIDQKELEKKVVRYLKNLPYVESDEDIDGVAVIRAIEAQHGIFVERAQKIYSFSHLTFQEYYTAKYIVFHHEKTLKPLIYNHCFDETWREVFLLTAEMLDDADGFFDIFIGFLDDFSLKDERLVRLLAMAEKEGNEIKSKHKLFENRSIAGLLILDISIDIDIDIDIDRDKARNIAKVMTYVRDIESVSPITSASASVNTLELVHALGNIDISGKIDLAIDLARNSKINHARDIVRDILRGIVIDNSISFKASSNITLARNIAKAIACASKITLTSTLIKSNKMKLSKLHKALDKVSDPAENVSKDDWMIFSKTMVNIFETHFNIEDYKFTEEQTEHVKQYLYATKLLIDCLKLACVSNKERIEERLLLPPQSLK